MPLEPNENILQYSGGGGVLLFTRKQKKKNKSTDLSKKRECANNVGGRKKISAFHFLKIAS